MFLYGALLHAAGSLLPFVLETV
ncbi:hypothetical protein DW083_12750 [Parabacteroides sp. AF48-14]|nr:hypothetical protein DW083_12750 [Parabacteroides sp. AF48-14]